MATLSNTTFDGNTDSIPESLLLKFAVGDGFAMYKVLSFSPLVLQHCTEGDGYRALPATIRGLNAKEAQLMIAQDMRYNMLFRNRG